MKLYTSYFAAIPKIRAHFPELKIISIARTTPHWVKVDGKAPELFPTAELLSAFKKDGDEKKYKRIYAEEVLDLLSQRATLSKYRGCVLCCWEGSGKFCHRHLVAKWIKKYTGEKVKELNPHKFVADSKWNGKTKKEKKK